MRLAVGAVQIRIDAVGGDVVDVVRITVLAAERTEVHQPLCGVGRRCQSIFAQRRGGRGRPSARARCGFSWHPPMQRVIQRRPACRGARKSIVLACLPWSTWERPQREVNLWYRTIDRLLPLAA
jgi:hypothetical protein